MDKQYFNRTERLVGSEAMERLEQTKGIVFGIGGVGSWAAECLVRTGVGSLTIVDGDEIAPSNVNRQLMATRANVGESKVEAMKRRLKEINPEARITALDMTYDEKTAGDFDLSAYDFVIDAIDSLSSKTLLISNATKAKTKFYSSMGAALKMDPTRVRVDEFWKVKGCRLAAALRQRMKRTGVMPGRKFKCVYSDELLPNLGEISPEETAKTYGKVAVNGTLAQITGIFGLTLAALAIDHIVNDSKICGRPTT